ncbi:MAG: hypothetical protein Q9227_007804 [Pyrenula ochraceoflavens]
MVHGRPAKRRRLTPPINDDAVSETIQPKALLNRVAEWDLEQAYEQKSRGKKEKESTRLPIKTRTGRIEQIEEVRASEDEADSFFGTDEDEGVETPPTEQSDVEPQVPPKQQIVLAKEELARLAALINEDPEEHAGCFKKLHQVFENSLNITVRKLALASQAAVYTDVIPGYRIRNYSDEELGSKISKDVRKLRQYEQALVTGYHHYIKQLANAAKRSKEGDLDMSGLRSVAINCICKLLVNVPHFNFRAELLNLLVAQVTTYEGRPEFEKCVTSLSELFSNDEDGAASLEAVRILTKAMKAKDYRVQQSVLNTFFHLRLLNEMSVRPADAESEKSDQALYRGKKVKSKWEHRTKKERKLARDRKKVAKDMKEADALVSHEEREKMQSETLKLVFATYFRILKLRIPNLMGAVLEGLAKFAHLINQDFFGDLLEALKDIVKQALGEDAHDDDGLPTADVDKRDFTREALLATQTAFTLLQNQEVSKSASALHLDLSFFTSHIFRLLYPLSVDADVELGPKSMHLADPHSSTKPAQPNKINVSTPSLLLTRALEAILLPMYSPQSATSPTLIATFFKRLLTVSLQTPEKSSQATLSLLAKVAQKHARKISPLWYTEERKGDGVYDGASETVDGMRVWCEGSGVWERELLKKHYCPGVREGWKAVEAMVGDLA